MRIKYIARQIFVSFSLGIEVSAGYVTHLSVYLYMYVDIRKLVDCAEMSLTCSLAFNIQDISELVYKRAMYKHRLIEGRMGWKHSHNIMPLLNL